MGGSGSPIVSPYHVRCVLMQSQSPDFVLKGQSFDSIIPTGNNSEQYSSKKKDLDLKTLSRKVNRVNLMQTLRRSLKYKYDMSKVVQMHKSSEEQCLDEENDTGQSFQSFYEIRGIKGVKAELVK